MSISFENSSGIKYRLGLSAKDILGQWDSMFRGSVGDIRWMLLDPNSLLYVSSTNGKLDWLIILLAENVMSSDLLLTAIRASPDSARQIIFGQLREEVIPRADLAWPSHTDWPS